MGRARVGPGSANAVPFLARARRARPRGLLRLSADTRLPLCSHLDVLVTGVGGRPGDSAAPALSTLGSCPGALRVRFGGASPSLHAPGPPVPQIREGPSGHTRPHVPRGGTSALNVPPLRTNPVWPVPRSTLEHHASSRLRELATPKVRNNIWCTHMSEVGAPLARIPGPPAASGWRPCRGAGSRPQSGGRGAGPALPTSTARHGDARSPPGRRHRVWLQPRHLVL